MWRFLFWTALCVGIVIGIARATAIRWWRVPADDPYLEASLAPTLRGGDLVILWRLTTPSTGDLVLCPEPKTPDRMTIGRIAGVQGETVTLEGDNFLLNGRRASTEGNCFQGRFSVNDPASQLPVDQVCFREQLGGKWHERSQTGPPRPKYTQQLGDGEVFLLSDNRQFPWDSREFGPAERDTCKETILFRLVSAKGYSDTENRFTFVH